MEQASPVLLIPQGWRAIAPSGWGFSLAPVLVLPPHLLGGSLGASGTAVPLPLDLSNGPGAAPCLAALASLSLPSPGVSPGPWRKDSGGDQVETWQEQKLQEGQWLIFFEEFTVCCDFSPPSLDKPLGLGAKQCPGRLGKEVLLS